MFMKKAVVAVGHSILVICWHLLAGDYQDLGGDWSTRRIAQHDREGSQPAVAVTATLLWFA
jgi:hypothetical protein